MKTTPKNTMEAWTRKLQDASRKNAIKAEDASESLGGSSLSKMFASPPASPRIGPRPRRRLDAAADVRGTDNVSKFAVGSAAGPDVRVRYLLRGADPEREVRQILNGFPPGSNVNDVAEALAAIGAMFADWADGTPGWALAYGPNAGASRAAAYDEHLRAARPHALHGPRHQPVGVHRIPTPAEIDALLKQRGALSGPLAEVRGWIDRIRRRFA